eukprot:CAMPEP_0174260538 /NCGR_PEP_ID=MMETSP0439-20130205/9889_1 /TAXON_ID=0 /ORGANISM="Stereomyxa ramosa, Strain Chinc5" /LENGTH=302 /DNA_ID=CAMNT_0015344797 /DNA_START=36 /DNA_END=942 /DNA_ORIENTATION=-
MVRYDKAFQFKSISGLDRLRHVIQFLATIFLNGKLLGIAATGIIVPYLHVTQAPFSVVSGAYESLEYTIARGVFPLLVLGIIYSTSITVGRVFCGWACPMGFVQDILSYLPFKKQRLSSEATNQLKDIKWGVLSVSIFFAILVGWRRTGSTQADSPMGVFSDSPFSVFSPASTLFAYIPWMMCWNVNVLATSGYTAWLKMGLLVAALVPSIYVPRFFCRYACPMGALMEPVAKYKSLKIYRNSKLSNEELNKELNDICPMGVQLGKDSSKEFIAILPVFTVVVVSLNSLMTLPPSLSRMNDP